MIFSPYIFYFLSLAFLFLLAGLIKFGNKYPNLCFFYSSFRAKQRLIEVFHAH